MAPVSVAFQLKRTSEPCSQCRRRRVACSVRLDSTTPSCHRCLLAGLDCDLRYEGDLRDANYNAELQRQIRRLEDVIERINRAQYGLQGADDAIDDIVGSLTQLCFSGTSTSRAAVSKDQLVQDATDLLSRPDVAHIASLVDAEHLLRDTASEATVEDLIQALPLEETARALMDAYMLGTPALAAFGQDGQLFWPDWPDEVEQLYQTPCDQIDLHMLAELFAVLSLGQRTLSISTPELAGIDEPRIEWYLDCAERALELGNAQSKPTLRAVRALQLLFVSNVLWCPHQSRLPRGLSSLVVGLSLADSLGWGKSEEYWAEAGELRATQHCRRAIFSALIRGDWYYMTSYGRPALSVWRSVEISSPSAICDEDLPSERLASSPWRPNDLSLLSIRLRNDLTQLHRRVILGLAQHEGTLSQEMMEGFADELLAIELRVPGQFKLVKDSCTDRMRWSISFDQLTIDEITFCLWIWPKISKTGILLHRPFIFGCSEATSYRYDWHRQECVRYCRQWIVFSVTATDRLQGMFYSIMSATWDGAIALALIIVQHPDHEEIHLAREELMSFIVSLRRRYPRNMPPAMARLSLLLTYLVDSATTVRRDGKKPRKGRIARPVAMSCKAPHRAKSPVASFDFRCPTALQIDDGDNDEMSRKLTRCTVHASPKEQEIGKVAV